MKFRRCTDDRSSYDDPTFLLQKITIKVGLKLWRLHRLQVQNWFHYLPTIITPNYCWLIFFFLSFFLKCTWVSTTPTIPLPIMNIFIIFFVKEKKAITTPQFLFWNVKLIERLIWLLQKMLLLIWIKFEFKVLFFLNLLTSYPYPHEQKYKKPSYYVTITSA